MVSSRFKAQSRIGIATHGLACALIATMAVSCKTRAFNAQDNNTEADSKANSWWDTSAVLDQEYPFPNEDEIVRDHVAFTGKEIQRNKSGSLFHRGFHAKGQACLKGEMTVASNLPAEYKAGVFANAKTYPVWARFSNGASRINPDAEPDPRGLAIKVLGVEGKQLLPARANETTQDFLGVNSPVFPVRNIKEFFEFHKAQVAGGASLAFFLATHIRTGLILQKHIDRNVASLLELKYWSGGSLRMGKRAAKFTLAPCLAPTGQKPEKPTDEYLTDDLKKRVGANETCVKFMVQLQKDPIKTPIEDPSVEWTEDLAKPVQVATIVFPKQTFDKPEQQAACEQMSFNPWQGVEAHQPLGNIMRIRKAVYDASIKGRHTLNKTPIAEPTN